MSMEKIAAVALALTIGFAARHADAQPRPDGMRFVPDVPGQFRALTERADALGVHIGSTPNPSFCKHYQGITRFDGPDGTPFFFVTRSGNTPGTPGSGIICDDSPGENGRGNLVVFRMDSRAKDGERMRSNRLLHGASTNGTAPPAEDRATIFFTVVEGGLVFRAGEGTLPQRAYQHPGGMQRVGHMLAMAADTRLDPLAACKAGCFGLPFSQKAFCELNCDRIIDYERATHPSIVMFFDVSNPEEPVFTSQFTPVNQNGDPLSDADGIAVTPLPGGLYLLAVTGGFDGDPILFYRSNLPDLSSPLLAWDFVARVSGPSVEDAHQSLHFLRESSIDGALYLAGARGHPVLSDHDRIDLYLVTCETADCAPGDEIALTTRYNGRRITPRPSSGGALIADLAAATGFHVTPSGELLFYATQHDNDGPDGTLNLGEWRHVDVVRESSPTLQPSIDVVSPVTVGEGGQSALSASARPPQAKPWIELFSEIEYSSDDYDQFYTVDFQDYDLDDFDDLPLVGDISSPRSWRWYAPVGCSILAIDRDAQGNVDETKTLVGTGFHERDPQLSFVRNDGGTDDIDAEIDGVEFLPGCYDEAAMRYELRWDGAYEVAGGSVTFDAALIDGPAFSSVPVQAQHPSGEGLVAQAAVAVSIVNVAPALTPLELTDSAGHFINTEVPFVLTNAPVTARTSFTDPGVADHQSATLAWGDGSVDDQAAFAAFIDAFGGATGALEHVHRFALSGTYAVALAVIDDDGGASAASTSVRVVAPDEAVQELIEQLDQLIAGTTDPKVLKDLNKARKALAGSEHGSSQNGALAKIWNGNRQAALAFLRQAISALTKAQSDGADVGLAIALLEQVIAAL